MALQKFFIAAVLFGHVLCPAYRLAQASADADVAFFENRVRPLLAEHCYSCHGEEREESSLRLDSYTGIMGGGESGDAVVPGEPDQSLMVIAVEYGEEDFQMPPDGKLPDGQIAVLRRWIAEGAAHPESRSERKELLRESVPDPANEFWAFTPPVSPSLPSVSDPTWIRTPIDAFILSQLEDAGLRPVSPTDRRTLIRRVTLDLLGLPPTPREVAAFVEDQRPGAFERVVDRLLASARYGERWGRHWLDVARYADSNGLDENIAHGNAWKYRDYVIAAMNADKPYDTFLLEQIAGDLLGSPDDRIRRERLTATGFLSLGPKVLAEGDELKMEMDIIDEQIDTLGRAVLGMTLGCARCHDHKFDPITTEDYYALAGIFKSTRTMESLKRIARWHENSIANSELQAAREGHDAQIATKKESIQALVDSANEELKNTLAPCESSPDKPESRYPERFKTELAKLRKELAELEKAAPEVPTAMGVQDGTVTDLKVHIRGNHLNLGKQVPRGFPVVMRGGAQPQLTAASSGRLELARWLTSPDQPLVARVIVNRIWRWHFGRGLVDSTDNFGRLGGRPANQPLLDWLATEFVGTGWSIKSLHRTIVLSATYRLASDQEEKNAEIDLTNTLHWRWSTRRLEAEAVRDSILAVSDLLDDTMGGSMLHVENREFFFDHTSKDETNYDSTRRSVYLPVVRNHLYDFFSMFDYSDASVPNGNRTASTVAPQALFMMNGELLMRASEALAVATLSGSSDESDSVRIDRLYRKVYGRPASALDVERARQYLKRFAREMRDLEIDQAGAPGGAWTALVHVLLASNEFIYVD